MAEGSRTLPNRQEQRQDSGKTSPLDGGPPGLISAARALHIDAESIRRDSCPAAHLPKF
jgi:hypothetical protein